MRPPLLAAILLALCACRGGEDCRARADELGRFLVAMDRDLALVPLGDDVGLVVRADLPALEPRLAPIVAIGRRGMVFDQQPVTGDLAARLKTAAERARLRAESADPSETQPPHVYLAIDRDTRWDAVVQAAATAHDAGFRSILLVFARPPGTPPPPRAAIDDELDDALADSPSGRMTALAKIATKVVAGCPALTRVFGGVAAVETDKAGYLAAETAPAVLECNCAIDIPDLRAVLWRLMGNPHPMSHVRIELASSGTPIELPAETPWHEASKRFTAGDRSTGTWLAVARR